MRLGLQKGLGRGQYLAAGIALFVVKIGLDFLIAHAFSKTYSILFYVSPVDAPLLRPAEDLTYWLTMWAVALPFIAIGLVLTIRRLRDAGLSPWLSLLFFAPFANMLFFVFCALVPSAGRHPNVVDTDVRVVHKLSYSRAAVSAGLVGALVGLSAFGVAVFLLGSYGASLFIGAPPIGGLIAGLLFARWHRPRFAGSILSGVLAVVIAGMLVIGFALEGLICLAMAFPLVLVGSIIGAGIGYLLERTFKGDGLTPTATALLFFPLTLIAEDLNPLPVPDALPVETSIVIDAPVERVWSNVVAFPQLPPADEWIFKVGIAAPIGAVIDGHGPGAVRRCIFTTGSFVEPIEIWDPPHELTFSVTSSPEPMREWTVWGGPRPPHLEGYLESVRGQFQLTPLSDGRTRLIGRTWYRTNMVPERYWRLWSDPIIHAIHLKVLRHVAALSERSE